MKFFALIFSTLWITQTFAQAITVQVSGNIFNTNRDSIFISQYFGNHYVDYVRGKLDKKGDYLLKGTVPVQDYYVLRIGNQHINLILRDKSVIKLNADGKSIFAFHNITGSDESIALNEFVAEMQRFQAKKDSASALLRRQPENAEAINQSFQREYLQFTSYRTSFVARNPNSPALLPVLSTLDIDKEYATYESIMKQLTACFSGSPNVEAAKVQFAEIQKKRAATNALAPGNPAPLFSQADRNGDPMSLKDLRGKVVLIDFWASWCGPCRKENPNVVNLYKKYKDAGFTVMSVSLDRDKNAWLAAIEKDGLEWPYHVSDLKYWSNEVAKMYQVSSIPFTVLVDREGNIIDTKLRGMELEQALKSIFGF